MTAVRMWKLGPLVVVRRKAYRAFGVTMPKRWRVHWISVPPDRKGSR